MALDDESKYHKYHGFIYQQSKFSICMNKRKTNNEMTSVSMSKVIEIKYCK